MLLEYILVSIVVSLGLVFGSIVSWMAEEELKGGKRYFSLTKKIIFILIIAVACYYLYDNLKFMIILLILSLFFLIMFRKVNLIFFYLLFAIIFWKSYGSIDLFYIISVLIFLFGFPVSALFLGERTRLKYFEKEKTSIKPKDFLRNIVLIYFPGLIFIIVAFALYFFINFL